jgi:hypothetical protein
VPDGRFSPTLSFMDKAPHIVALYGQSLVMGGIAASLARHPDITLHQVNGYGPDLAAQLITLHPDVLIFDLATGCPDDIGAWLLAQPRCLLLGIDLNRQEVCQWRGQHTRALTMQDLVQTIQQEAT